MQVTLFERILGILEPDLISRTYIPGSEEAGRMGVAYDKADLILKAVAEALQARAKEMETRVKLGDLLTEDK